ncbi:hypothetical protein CFL01nite_12280 [Corynebacterium flavescens]|uniref:Transposase n=1 Tax=Corynebacterium flavescens TaxID=28028 RepID=A0AB73B7A2_CORFL|nr:hypothetical protein CFL01nite_12280 [Corynebacterium flavescens]
MIKPPCPDCGRVHCEADVRTIGRFTTITGYKDLAGNLHKTRQAAEAANCHKEKQ